MLNIKYLSDIHFDISKNRGPLVVNPDPDAILLIPGDMCEINALKSPGGITTLERICRAYKHVYAVTGNHEFYGNFIDTGTNFYRDLTRHIPNFTILDNEVVDLGEYLLVGTPLWTDFAGGDPIVKTVCRNVMNDYVYIFRWIETANGTVKRQITPDDTEALHHQAVDFLEKTLANAEKPVIVMTHHAPMLEHCNDQRHGAAQDNPVNFAYATDLKDLVTHPSVVAWVHGHTHDSKVTYFGDVPLQTHARGYYEKAFDPMPLIIAPTQGLLDLEDTSFDF